MNSRTAAATMQQQQQQFEQVRREAILAIQTERDGAVACQTLIEKQERQLKEQQHEFKQTVQDILLSKQQQTQEPVPRATRRRLETKYT